MKKNSKRGRPPTEHGKRRHIGFTDPQWEWLQSEADRLGITISELVRRIIDATREEKHGTS